MHLVGFLYNLHFVVTKCAQGSDRQALGFAIQTSIFRVDKPNSLNAYKLLLDFKCLARFKVLDNLCKDEED